MKTLIVSSILLFTFNSFLYSQSPQENLAKYWKYRERLKNFVVVGDCQGCSLPAKNIDGNGVYHWNDETILLGQYIGMLALEYRILANNSSDLTNTKKELFYAIEAFNRLDYKAESYWRIPENVQSGDLNGFFIRDDVPSDFFTTRYDDGNGEKPIIEYLQEGLVPSERDEYDCKEIDSGFRDGEELRRDGPIEESLDQVVDLYLGFALVASQVPVDDNYPNHQFLDGETSFVHEVQKISQRILNHMISTNYIILNPALFPPLPVEGIYNADPDKDCSSRNPTPWACNGANAVLFAYGFATANCFIQGVASGGNTLGCIGGILNVDPTSETIWLWWKNHHLPNDQDNKFLTLEAIANTFGSSTSDFISERSLSAHTEHLPLVFQLLHNGENTLPNNLYTCMLDQAPCFGTNCRNSSYEWGNSNRLFGGPSNTYSSDESFGIDYMFYLNIYNILHPEYLNNSYNVTSQKELCKENIVLPSIPIANSEDHYDEKDNKNYWAGNSIVASNYIIMNNSTLNSPYTTNVVFKAKNNIILLPGFSVNQGALFHASIDTELTTMECNNLAIALCTNCEESGNEIQNGSYNISPSFFVYKPESTPEDILFVIMNNYLFKIRGNGGTGDNMFDLNLSSSTYVIGSQSYVSRITNVNYVNGNTFVSCENGLMYKINEIGGTGQNMFTGYTTGSEEFSQSIVKVIAKNGILVIALADGKMLKTNTTGTGTNMFGINETNNDITDLGYGHYLGDQKFSHPISYMEEVGNYLYISTSDGKLLKINSNWISSGNNGDNMFGINETTNHITDLGYGYFSGFQKFSHPVVYMKLVSNNILYVCMYDGKTLKLSNGIVCTGQNMFAIQENTNDIDGLSGYNYYVGDQKFSSYVTGILEEDGEVIFSFNDGRMFKAYNCTSGCTGHRLFNIEETSRGFQTYDWGYNAYLQGCMNFEVPITQLAKINSTTFLSLYNGKIIKLIGSNTGTGNNMYALADNGGCLQNLCGNNYLIGCENYWSLNFTKNALISYTTNEIALNKDSIHSSNDFVKLYPNPTSSSLFLEVSGDLKDNSYLTINDLLGNNVSITKITSNKINVSVKDIGSGVYPYKIIVDDQVVMSDKLVIIK